MTDHTLSPEMSAALLSLKDGETLRVFGRCLVRTMGAPPSLEATSLSVRLVDVLTKWVPGSFPQPWSWDDEEKDIRSRLCLCCGQPGHYQQQLEDYVSEHGITQGILLGDDGRVWDGHHRIIAARRLGIESLPLEAE